MALIFDGVTISELDGVVNCNGTNITEVVADGIIVWTKYKGGDSPLIVTSNKTLIAGVDFPANADVTVCMCGGGGSGGNFGADGQGHAGGGYAGQVNNSVLNIPSGTSVSVTIGTGGASQTTKGANGNAGTNSVFGSFITATGGSGGTGGTGSWGFHGDHQTVTTCGGTGYNGYDSNYGTWYQGGGQSSGFGNGSDGSWDKYHITPAGGVGSGSGGAGNNRTSSQSGAGGRGEVRISW